ncbi:uncharacterized protein LOC121384573 [Gigantopelta aegis]|uniref:uncharacterized protein LOC121384573 n=1 Tax=Gigantopelta aegis TaxID=1735272 RepID=UPI001B888F67|nr:uncharacterized protein LOC121384573 [Gigantopelta aegis]
MSWEHTVFLTLILWVLYVASEPIPLPPFSKLKAYYPGYWNFGGRLHNHHLIRMLGCESNLLLHDTSALRLSFALNKIGGAHSLGTQLIRLSKYGRDSVSGKDGRQYIYHPIAYGPYLADKYGYPSISKLHQMDAANTKKNFWGKQGILRVITYTKKLNRPKGHVALWDCDHFHEAKDWIVDHGLITVEFWESPDSNCANKDERLIKSEYNSYVSMLIPTPEPSLKMLLKHKTWRRHFVKKYFLQTKRKHPANQPQHHREWH